MHVPHRLGYRETNPNPPRETDPIIALLPGGDASMVDNKMSWGGQANRSSKRRPGITRIDRSQSMLQGPGLFTFPAGAAPRTGGEYSPSHMTLS
jgi:hypothetical protein